MIRWRFLLSLLILSACGGTDSGDPGTQVDIRDGDLDSLSIEADGWGLDFLGNPSRVHNHDFDATCPVNAAGLDDGRDTAAISLVEVNHLRVVVDFWFADRSRCREAGALLTAARAEFAAYGFADSTKDFTKIVYRIRGGVFDSLRVPADVTLDSVSFPGLSVLVQDLERVLTL